MKLRLELAQEICDAQDGIFREDNNIDLECVILVVQLLMNNLPPHSDLRQSILRIFRSQSGEHLQAYLSDSDDLGARVFTERLAWLSKSNTEEPRVETR